MTLDSFDMITGCDIPVVDGVTVRQPRIGRIMSIQPEPLSSPNFPRTRYEKYNSYINILSLRPEDLLKPEVYSELPQNIKDSLDVFALLLIDPNIQELLLEALSFFVIEQVSFNPQGSCFVTNTGGIINAENFDRLRTVILKVCCCFSDEVVEPKFGGARAQKIYEKIMKGREAAAKAGSKGDKSAYMLWNVLSSLSAKHPSINLVTARDYTVYQIYDQFNRTCVNAQIAIIGQRWAAWGKDEFDFTTWYRPIDTKTSS